MARLTPSTRVLAVLGVLGLTVMTVVAVFAPLFTWHPPDRTSGPPFARPSAEHLLGTDDLGRDLWAQLLFGARVSLLVGLFAAVAAVVIGTAVALLAGYRGGWVDAVLMRVVDLVLSLPFLVLVLVLATYFGRGLGVLVVLIAGVLWARPARLLRAQVLKLRTLDHVVSAEAMGASTPRILVRHLLPRLTPLVSSQFVRAATVAVVVQSGVAFLGLGDPGRVSWGSTLFFANNGNAILTDAWRWWVLPPGIALTIVIVSLAFVGAAVEEWAEPRLATHGHRRKVRRRLDPDEPTPAADDVALDIRSVSIAYDDTAVVREVDLRVRRGRVLGLVGESGSGKSTLAMGLVGLLAPNGRVTEGSAVLGDLDLRRLGRDRLAERRGRDIAVVPQAAMGLLDPTMRVIRQVAEVAGRDRSAGDAAERARLALTDVGIDVDRHGAFPHELSGGMRQRVVVAMATVNRPKLLIADEPTTGLDVVTQLDLLRLLLDRADRHGSDLVVVSHDLPLVGSVADDLAVMYAGRIVETGSRDEVLDDPQHPYTRALLSAFPPLDGPRRDPTPIPGDPPDPGSLASGCAYRPRCPHATDRCSEERPPLVGPQRQTACHLVEVR